MLQMNLQNRDRLADTENRLVDAEGEGGEGKMDWEFEISRCKLLYREWIKKMWYIYIYTMEYYSAIKKE